VAWGTILRGATLTEGRPKPAQDQVAQGIDEIRRGIAAWRAIGATVTLPSSLASLAQGCIRAGNVDEALSVIAEALRLANEKGERCWEAELYRLRGESLSRQGDEIGAGECFHRAIDTARHQRARSWELRAATSLSRSWQRQGRARQARVLLNEVYGWFTEGFDTPDLREAKGLLKSLATEAG
jgi:adenylate cyclase